MVGTMKLITDPNEPTLVGILEAEDDLDVIQDMVSVLNNDLLDSGFEKYQYEAILRGNKIYIEQLT